MTPREERILKVALSMVPGVSPAVITAMEDASVEAGEFFSLDTSELSARLGMGHHVRFEKLAREEAYVRARSEMDFIEKHGLRTIFISDSDYPFLLRETPDAPVLLYCLGDAELAPQHILSMVGTRRCTAYGKSWCENNVADLAAYFPDMTIVSGLAYGIDSIAHSAALEHRLPTIAVVAHGLDTIYPAAHRELAKRIVKEGGAIISEYPRGTTPFSRRFLERNRIVAGISELTMVVESQIKGGAMSTANLAFSYSRDVGALPGRCGDRMSEGCNHLIRTNKAHLITCAADFIELLGWAPAGIHVTAQQRNLFPDLTGDGAEICRHLRSNPDPLNTDTLHSLTGLPVPALMSALTELEFDGIITRLPGNRYAMA